MLHIKFNCNPNQFQSNMQENSAYHNIDEEYIFINNEINEDFFANLHSKLQEDPIGNIMDQQEFKQYYYWTYLSCRLSYALTKHDQYLANRSQLPYSQIRQIKLLKNPESIRAIEYDYKRFIVLHLGLIGYILFPAKKKDRVNVLDIKIIFRGTNPKDKHSLNRDIFEKNAGSDSFAQSRYLILYQIQQVINEILIENNTPHIPININITGHSLGGADAQNCMVAIMQVISQSLGYVPHISPIPEVLVQQFKQFNINNLCAFVFNSTGISFQTQELSESLAKFLYEQKSLLKQLLINIIFHFCANIQDLVPFTGDNHILIKAPAKHASINIFKFHSTNSNCSYMKLTIGNYVIIIMLIFFNSIAAMINPTFLSISIYASIIFLASKYFKKILHDLKFFHDCKDLILQEFVYAKENSMKYKLLNNKNHLALIYKEFNSLTRIMKMFNKIKKYFFKHNMYNKDNTITITNLRSYELSMQAIIVVQQLLMHHVNQPHNRLSRDFLIVLKNILNQSSSGIIDLELFKKLITKLKKLPTSYHMKLYAVFGNDFIRKCNHIIEEMEAISPPAATPPPAAPPTPAPVLTSLPAPAMEAISPPPAPVLTSFTSNNRRSSFPFSNPKKVSFHLGY